MGPNIRVAMLISLSFIGVFAWLVNQVSRPLVAASSRMIVTRSRSGPAAVLISRLSSRAPRFRTASVFERQSLAAAKAMPHLAVKDNPRSVRMGRVAGMTLPPLSAIARRWANRAVSRPRPVTEPGQAAGSSRSEEGPTLAVADIDRRPPIEETNSQAGPARNFRHDVGRERPSTDSEVQLKRYVVRKGDSLWSIARSEWNVADEALIRRLIRANPQLRDRDDIRIGQMLIIPARADAMRPSPAVAEVGQRANVLTVATDSARWYTIRKNDSLERIARRELKNPRRWPEIVKLNRTLDARKPIHAGTRIKLPDT